MFSVIVMQAHTIYPSIESAIANDFPGCFSPRLKNRHHGEIISCYTNCNAFYSGITGFVIFITCMKDKSIIVTIRTISTNDDQKF